MQAPARFIAVAEETGLILELGRWGLGVVADFARRMNVGRARPLNFAVNVSRIQFAHADMPELLRTVVRETGVDPAWLTIELTESTLADDQDGIISALHEIRSMGFGLAIDDFGTGYSSLRYLQDFPVSEIKLDRGFISGLQENSFNRILVESVVKIGRALGASVTAEGIETQAEHDVLKVLGCPFGQGFLFAAPMDAEAFEGFTEAGGPEAQSAGRGDAP
jgi:EAL domain-containing protein (putative c-di-GMP-specific phosphodiesterase class I)